MTIEEIAERFTWVRATVERTPEGVELESDVLRESIRLARDLSSIAAAAIPLWAIRALDRWFAANNLPRVHPGKDREAVGELTSTDRMNLDRLASYAPPRDVTREDIVHLMRENWQDPAGFHGALAELLSVEEGEIEPPANWTYTISREVIEAAARVAKATANDGDFDEALYADVKLVCETIANDDAEPVL